ncbi:protein-tyrosine phosphatase-like, PTPLA isoform X2 [Wolffia australiana]
MSPLFSNFKIFRAIALAKIFGSYVSTDSVHGAYNATGDLICILQLASFLEVLHAAVGFVPSGVLFSLMQWGGRTHFLLAIVRQIEEVQELPSVFITFLAWSISEIYSLYCLISRWRGSWRDVVDVPSSSLHQRKGSLLLNLCRSPLYLPYICLGCASLLPFSVAKAVLAPFQAKESQVEHQPTGQERVRGSSPTLFLFKNRHYFFTALKLFTYPPRRTLDFGCPLHKLKIMRSLTSLVTLKLK